MRRWLRHVPNAISALRIALVIPIAVALLKGRDWTAMGLFAAAAISDALDGFIAKRCGWQSELGGVLDPAADKLLLVTALVVLAWLERVPVWLVAAAVARDLIIALGALAYRLYVGPVEARPSHVSKLNTLCQALYIVGVLAWQRLPDMPAWVPMLLGALTFQTTVISGVDYVLRYAQAARGHARARGAASRVEGGAS